MKKVILLLVLTLAVGVLAACQTADSQSTPTAMPHAEPTELPVAEPTVMPTVEATVEPTPVAAAPEPISLDMLTANSWQWESFTGPVEQFDVETAEGYVLTFGDDGTVAIRADCNNAFGSYSVDEGALTIEVGPMTMAACPPGSRSDQFVQFLGFAAGHFFEEGKLFIDLFADGGTMVFAEAAASAEAATEAAPPEADAITVEELRNTTYSGIYDDPVTLTDGLWEGEPYVEGDPARPMVEYADGSATFGDLDGDGVDDAVVFLMESGGGTAHITYIAAQLNDGGQPVDAGSVRIDEVRVRSAEVADGQVMVEIVTIGPGDGDCCPSHKASRIYALQDGALAEVGGAYEDLAKVSEDDLDGTDWALLELAYDQPALTDALVTVTFQDGQISGSGGCNSYNGSFELGEDNPFVMTIGPIVSTNMACPDPILEQETAYFKALETVAQWDYLYGRLALYHFDEATRMYDRLLFERLAGEPEVVPAEDGAISVEQLKNATYSGIYDDPATLTDGLWEGEPYAEGDPARPRVEYADGSARFGDLDGDGVDDAVVFLMESGGGTAHIIYVAAQLHRDGQLVDAGSVWVDEVRVWSAEVVDGQVMAEIVVIGPGDGDCCPSHKASRIYALQDGKLAEVGGQYEDLVKVSENDLDGTSWTLLEMDYDEPALADTEVTISIQDGRISGSGGCNTYNASYDLGQDNPFVMTIGPIAATKMACPEPILEQETSYFEALADVAQWDYHYGRLVLAYFDEAERVYRRLLFEPQAKDVAVAEGDSLTAQTWQWESFTGPMDAYDIDAPESYTLMFQDDGTVDIKADCNLAMGNYTDDQGSLQIEVLPMTMAACLPESRSDQFVQYLGYAARYFFDEGQLFIDLFADGGTMALSSMGVTAHSPVQAGEGDEDMLQALMAKAWQWTAFSDPLQHLDVEMPTDYMLSFSADGTVNITADCNNAVAEYSTDDGSLTIEVGPMTMASCPPDSRSEQFLGLLGGAARYFFEAGDLYIDLMADGGTMVFSPVGGAETAGADQFDPDATPIFAILGGGGNDDVWLDPTLISIHSGVVGGEAIDASLLGAGCAGMITWQPDVALYWIPDDDVETLRIFFVSGGDPTMVVVTPTGETLCSDDLNPLVLDPYIEVPNPVLGRYAIYLGSFEDDVVEPGFLVFTGHDLNPATFDIASLVPRRVDPAALGEPVSIEVLDMTGAPVALDAEDTPFQRELVGGGNVAAFNIAELDNPLCTGFIAAAPTFSFEWSGEVEKLLMFFEGDTDSTLVVHTPIDTFACDDDVHGARNLNPALDLTPIPGTYHVWVGSFAPDTSVNGTLTIAGTSDLQPAVLTADMISGQ